MKQRGTKLCEPSSVDEVKPLMCDRTRAASSSSRLQWHPQKSSPLLQRLAFAIQHQHFRYAQAAQ